tara:strand:+ start:396 stop:1133 length:738 start_codon:yes stop_codon:yes gene_type:complete
MADFWIKIEKSTPDKPEIFEMAEHLDIEPDAVLGKLIRVWCWLDSNSENGHIKSVTDVLINRLTMSDNFAEAMKMVGWLSDGNVPNFDRHLGESSKKRAKDAERKRKSRETSSKGHTETVTESGLDKSRVDKSKDTTAELKIPICPHELIIDLYHDHLPNLPAVQKSLWSGSAREKDLRARWKQSPNHQSLEFWGRMFKAVAKSPATDWYFSGIGSGDFVNWEANLGWMIKRSNFDKTIERLTNG